MVRAILYWRLMGARIWSAISPFSALKAKGATPTRAKVLSYYPFVSGAYVMVHILPSQ